MERECPGSSHSPVEHEAESPVRYYRRQRVGRGMNQSNFDVDNYKFQEEEQKSLQLSILLQELPDPDLVLHMFLDWAKISTITCTQGHQKRKQSNGIHVGMYCRHEMKKRVGSDRELGRRKRGREKGGKKETA